MFRKVISHSPLVNTTANTFFASINGSGFDGDFSFLSTLRALVYPRMGKDERIFLYFTSSDHRKRIWEDLEARRVIQSVYPDNNFDSGSITIINMRGNIDDNEAAFSVIEDKFTKVYHNYVRLEKVTDFFRQSFKIMCFIDEEKHKVVVFCENMNIRRMHYIQCAIFAFLPWYFDPQVGVNADEMELIKSLREKESDKYEACLEKVAAKYDFRTLNIKNLLKGFETRYERIEAERLRSRIMDIISSIDNLEEEISRYLNDKREADTMLLGIETKIAQEQENEDSEIMQYFLCNKKLQLNTVNDSIMTFSCEDYLTYFDEEMAKSMIDNPRSYVYVPNGRACNNYIKAEDMKRLMYAIFIDQTLRIKFCAAYQFELGRRVRALSGFDYDSNFKNCMPNPHTDHYSCMGNYEREITNRIRENDYIGAIEQAIASCKSLNFGDSTVMKRFIEQMYGLDGYTHNVCVELPDGKFVTPKEAAEFLKNKEEKGKEQADE